MSSLDIYILVILGVCLLHGYRKGLVYQVLSLLATSAVALLAYIFSSSIGQVLAIALMNSNHFFDRLKTIFPSSSKLIGFVILYIGLSIIKLIFFKIIESSIGGIIDSFSLTKKLNHLAGALIGIIQGLLLSTALALCFAASTSQQQMVDDSLLANQIIERIPNVKESISKLSLVSFTSNRDYKKESVLALIDLIDVAMDQGFIKEEQLLQLTVYYADALEESNQHYELTEEEYEHILEVVNQPGIDPGFKQSLLSKVSVK